MLGILMDISERKKMELDLRKSKDELELRIKERTQELEESIKALQTETSEHVSTQEELATSEQNYKTLIDSSPEAICGR